MKVTNIHQRRFDTTPERVGTLLDSLASAEDALWPTHSWPRMKLDRPLGIGAEGGHGPIGYFVEDYVPGRSIRFRFTQPKGFNGFHQFEILQDSQPGLILRHTIEMYVHGAAVLTWPLIFRPLHDALLEDSLATVQASLGQDPQIRKWSLWVRFLRRVLSGGKIRIQVNHHSIK